MSDAPKNGHQERPTGENLSLQLLEQMAQASVPLPETVALKRVRALHKDEIKRLVAQEVSAWEEKVRQLETELSEAIKQRSTTTRHELPRLAGLVEEEKTRADQLESEMVLLEGRIQELETEADEREKELDELRARAEGAPDPEAEAQVAELEQQAAELQGRIQELEAAVSERGGDAAEELAALEREVETLRAGLQDAPTDAAFEAMLGEFARSEDRAKRISELEDLVWQLAEDSSDQEAFKRAMQDLRMRCDGLQSESHTTQKRLRDARLQKEALETRVRELLDGQEQHEIELQTLQARHLGLEGALEDAREQVAALQKVERNAFEREAQLEERIEELEARLAEQTAELAKQTEAELSAQISALQNADAEVSALQEADAQIAALQEERLEAADREVELAEKIVALEGKLAALAAAGASDPQTVRLQAAERAELEDTVSDLETKLDELSTQAGDLEQPLDPERERVLEETVARLEAELAESSDMVKALKELTATPVPDPEEDDTTLEDATDGDLERSYTLRHSAPDLRERLRDDTQLDADAVAFDMDETAVDPDDPYATPVDPGDDPYATPVESYDTPLGIPPSHFDDDDTEPDGPALPPAVLEDPDDGIDAARAARALTRVHEKELTAVQAELDAVRKELEQRHDSYAQLEAELLAARDAFSEEGEALECELEAVRGALEARSARAQELEAELSAVRAELVERRDEADAEDELSAARRAFRDSVDRIDGLERQLRAARSNLSESRLAEAALTWKLDTVEQSLELRLEAAEEVFADLEGVRQRADEALAEREAKLTEARASLEESRAVARALEEELEALRSDNPEVAEVQAKLKASQAQVEKLGGELADLRTELSSKEDLADALELELAVIKGTLDGAKSATEMMRSEALKSEERREQLEAELRSVRATTRLLEADLEAAHSIVTDREQSVGKLQEQLLDLRKERDTLRLSAIKAKPPEDEADVEALQIGLERAEAELLEAQAELTSAREEAAGLAEQLAEAKVEVASLREELVGAEAQAIELESLRVELESLRAEQAALAAAAPTDAAEADVLRAEVELLRAQLASSRELPPPAPAEPSPVAAAGDAAAAEAEIAELQDQLAESAMQVVGLRKQLMAAKAQELELEATQAELDELRAQVASGTAPAAEPSAAAASTSEDAAEVTELRSELHATYQANSALEQAQVRLRAEIRDFERALESECWRGLATHRDLVNAHQRIRELEQAGPSAAAPGAASADVGELEGRIHELERELAHARNGDEPSDEDETFKQDAMNWLVGAPPEERAFVADASDILPQLDQQLSETRRHLRRAREEFQAERKGLVSEVMSADRALENAAEVGFQADELDRKQKRATAKLKKFDGILEVELKTLEEKLHTEEDLRHWLAQELGQLEPEDGTSDDQLEDASEEISALSEKLHAEEEQRHTVEMQAMQAMMEMERERANLEVELNRLRAQNEEQGMIRVRLEQRVKELQEQKQKPAAATPTAPRAEDPLFNFQAERIAVLNYTINDRDSALHWLLHELDPGHQQELARQRAEFAESVRGSDEDPTLRADLLHWLGEGGNGNGNGGNGHTEREMRAQSATEVMTAPELPATFPEEDDTLLEGPDEEDPQPPLDALGD